LEVNLQGVCPIPVCSSRPIGNRSVIEGINAHIVVGAAAIFRLEINAAGVAEANGGCGFVTFSADRIGTEAACNFGGVRI